MAQRMWFAMIEMTYKRCKFYGLALPEPIVKYATDAGIDLDEVFGDKKPSPPEAGIGNKEPRGSAETEAMGDKNPSSPEAGFVASLNHPHICTLYDVGHQSGTAFLVMEYLEGETLVERLKKGPLPLDQVLQYAIEIVGRMREQVTRSRSNDGAGYQNVVLLPVSA
jgi:hypothetical protein